MSTEVTVGHQVDYVIQYVDSDGNPMLQPVTPDSPPTWANAPDPSDCDTFAPAADGSSAVVQAQGAGSDTISVQVTVSGVQYSASDQVTISAAPQTLGGIELVATVS